MFALLKEKEWKNGIKGKEVKHSHLIIECDVSYIKFGMVQHYFNIVPDIHMVFGTVQYVYHLYMFPCKQTIYLSISVPDKRLILNETKENCLKFV